MRSLVATIKTDGRAEAASPGVGFRVRPGALPRTAPDYARTSRPGSYPIRVRLNGEGEPLLVQNADSYYFSDAKREEPAFKFLQLVDGESGDLWHIDIFETRQEGQTPAGRPSRAPFELLPAGTSAPAANPALSTDGFPLRPGQRRITTYFAGAAGVATLWVRQLNGTWLNTLETIDSTVQAYDTREVAVPGDRAFWRAAAAGLTMTVEVEAEVG